MEDAFFNIIRLAIGTDTSNVYSFSEDDWDKLNDFASKHKLTGIVFIGIQKYIEILKNKGIPETEIIPRKKYLKWLGAITKISQHNELINEKCGLVQSRFRKEGFKTCILKGQGVAKLYGELSFMRQSGDIDIWMWPKGDWTLGHDERMKIVVCFIRSICKCGVPTYHNIAFKLPNGTDVEAHYTPSWMFSPLHNHRLQKWFKEMAESEMKNDFSTLEFNRIFILLHIYRHLFGEGIGLRQIIDYFFVLRSKKLSKNEICETMKFLESLGVKRFVSALMWVMYSKLGLEEEFLLCKPNEKEGQFLLSEILQAGNFGMFDERINRNKKRGVLSVFYLRVIRNFHFLSHYPSEVLWCPLWKIWHQLWLLKLAK